MAPSHVFIRQYCFVTSLPDPKPGHPLHPEEHQEEPRGEGLALVEALHHRAAADRGAAHRGADPGQGRECSNV